MGKITKPGKVKLSRAPRRPAWLYPEGTIHVSDVGIYRVARTYGTHVQPSADPSLHPDAKEVVTETRSMRYWEKV